MHAVVQATCCTETSSQKEGAGILHALLSKIHFWEWCHPTLNLLAQRPHPHRLVSHLGCGSRCPFLFSFMLGFFSSPHTCAAHSNLKLRELAELQDWELEDARARVLRFH